MKMPFIYVCLFSMVPMLAYADARVHLDTAACHIPWDTNTDNEAKLSICSASLNERDGVVSAWANETRKGVPEAAVPVVPTKKGNGNNVVCSSIAISNIGACDVTDDDGNEYSTATWTAVTRVCTQKKKDGPGYAVDYNVECPNAARN